MAVQVWLHRGRSSATVNVPPLLSLLRPMIALSTSWCCLAKSCVVFLVLLLFLARFLWLLLTLKKFLVSVWHGWKIWVSWRRLYVVIRIKYEAYIKKLKKIVLKTMFFKLMPKLPENCPTFSDWWSCCTYSILLMKSKLMYCQWTYSIL